MALLGVPTAQFSSAFRALGLSHEAAARAQTPRASATRICPQTWSRPRRWFRAGSYPRTAVAAAPRLPSWIVERNRIRTQAAIGFHRVLGRATLTLVTAHFWLYGVAWGLEGRQHVSGASGAWDYVRDRARIDLARVATHVVDIP